MKRIDRSVFIIVNIGKSGKKAKTAASFEKRVARKNKKKTGFGIWGAGFTSNYG